MNPRKFKYSIEIKEPSKERLSNDWCKHEKYSVWYDKNFGNMSGGVTGCANLEDLRLILKGIISEWDQCDAILGKIPEKPSKSNLEFKSFTDEITLSDVFGEKTLDAWIIPEQQKSDSKETLLAEKIFCDSCIECFEDSMEANQTIL